MSKSYTLREASEILKVSYETLRQAWKRNEITNPISDETVYEAVRYGWANWRRKMKFDKR